jgi:hypothetical protein
VSGGEGRLPLLPAPLFVSVLLLLLASVALVPSRPAWAQASGATAPSTGDQAPQSGQDQSQPGQAQTQPSQPQPQPGQAQPIPIQPFQPYQPGQPPRPQAPTPPQWTPPVPPTPSQSHAPGQFTLPFPLVQGAVFEYHPSTAVSEEYTDNFTLARKHKISNFRTTVTPGSTLLINSANTHGSISASSGFSYDTATGEDNIKAFPSLNAAVQHTFTPRLSLTLTDSFDRNDEPTRAESSGLQSERRTFISNAFGASVAWALDLLQTQYYYRNALFLGDQDTISHVFGVGASTRVGPLDSVSAGYEYSISQPEEGVSSYGNLVTASWGHQLGYFTTVGLQGSYSAQSLDGQRVWNASVYTTYGVPTGFSFSGRVGYSVLTSDVASDQSGISAAVTASYIHAKGTISLSYFQDFRTTYQGGRNLQTGQDQASPSFGVVQSRGISGSFTYALTPFIGSFINASYYQNTNTGVGNVKSNDSQDYFTASAGISWQLLRWLSMQIQYTRNQYTRPDRDENRGVISLSAYF